MSLNHSSQHTSGFSLIELLLYIAITSVFIVVLGNMGIAILTQKAKTDTFQEIQYSADFAMHRITEAMHESVSVNIPLKDQRGSTLSLEMRDIASNPTRIEVVDGRIRMTEGNGQPFWISTQNTAVQSLDFIHLARMGDADAVGIDLVIDSRTSGEGRAYRASHRFHTTVVTKNTP